MVPLNFYFLLKTIFLDFLIAYDAPMQLCLPRNENFVIIFDYYSEIVLKKYQLFLVVSSEVVILLLIYFISISNF